MSAVARPKEGEGRARVNFTLSPETVEGLQRLSKETDVPMARIVERALREYLKVHLPKEEE